MSEQLLYKQQQQLCDAVALALETAKAQGASAEVSVTKAAGLSVSSRCQEVENIEFNNDGALGISVYVGQQKGNASTSDLSKAAIKQTVQAAIDIAQHTSADPCAGLAPRELLAFDAPNLDLYHPHSLEIDDAIALTKEIERAALDFDPRIVNSNGAALNAVNGCLVYGNTEGMLQSYLSSRYSISCSVIGQNGGELERDYEYSIARKFSDLATPQWVGQEAARKTLAHLNPQKLTSRTAPVIFMNDVATGLMGHFASAISGGSLYRKASFLLDSLGKQILPSWFQINERPHLLGQLASTPFDSEGVRTQDATIVENGVVKDYLLTNYSARKLGLQSNGHAGGIHNWLLHANRTGGLDSLLKEMGTGLLVTDFMGMGVNLITGDYSRGASGFWVENGEIQFPVAEITIAGSLPEMLKNIVAMSDDIERRSNIQTGSMLLDSMKISGN